MNFIFDNLIARGIIEQTTNYEIIKKILNEKKITFYVGFDATSDSLHIGHLIQLITIIRLQNAGHNVIILIGGATTLIGDPSGKNQLRKMLNNNEIEHNIQQISKQIINFVHIDNSNNFILNNMSWLGEYKYIDFIRNFGSLFSVNRMIKSECFKTRLEKGLTFLEFNYTLLQSYDFLYLFQKRNCILQIGGNDQWSNIVHGIDLVRRIENKEVYGMTMSLLTKSNGQKMGKTENGAIWLDKNKTTPYSFFQYWRNINDDDVIKCMKFLTFFTVEKIKQYEKSLNNNINSIKEILAFEITKIVHGEMIANNVLKQTKSTFINKDYNDVIKFNIPKEYCFINNKINIIELLKLIGFAKSNTDAKILISQLGIRVNHKIINDIKLLIDKSLFLSKDGLLIQKGKKNFIKIFY